VNQLLDARRQMAKMMKTMGAGGMPSLPGMELPGGLPSGKPRPSATRKSASKRKKKARR
jgi:hypothetical protein